ncbi:SETMAR, partial [Cordylochernes scorpioides]
MVIGLKRAGWSIRQIAADTHLGASTVHPLWRRWLEQGNVAIYRNVGATRVTSARVDRRILRQAVAAPQATCTAILQHGQDTLDHSISTRTISRRLVANGLHSCRPLRRLPLTPPNRRQRLEWCRARSTWMTEWHRVVFSDESRFCLSSDSRRVRVWRRRGERSNPAAIVERPTVRQRGIMVWGAIAYDSRSPLLRIQGTMTAQRYVDDVLRPVTLPYLQGVPNALYQQDNARPHTARISQQALQDVQMLPWPPCSPDLSPIEHVWDIIGRRLHALPQPRSEDELWQMVEREWRAIPQDAIRTLIDSLPRRVAACIAVRGAKRYSSKSCLSDNFELDNEPRGKPHQKFADAEQQALLDEDSAQTQEKLAKQLQVSQGAVSLRLNSLRMTQKLSRWVPHELSERQQEGRLVTCEGLLARHEKKSFSHRIVTSDEKSIYFSNPMRQRSWGLLGQFPKQKPMPNRLGKKAMLCVWWDQTSVVYFKLLKPGETVNTSRYEQQMHSLREALNEIRPELREKHNKLILQHDNAPAHNATVVKNTIKDLGWELLPHPPYSPDLAPSDYHLFTSLGHTLKNQEFSNSDILRKWLVD